MGRIARRRYGASVVAMVVALGAIAGSASAQSGLGGLDGGPSESMPPAPTGRAAERLRALYPEVAEDETSGDVTALVVTHTVRAKIATDEEWRAFYGSYATAKAADLMETADNEMFVQFGIDFVHYATSSTWDSGDSNRTACTILGELGSEVPQVAPVDVVLGYSNTANNGSKGCASGNHMIVLLHGNNDSERTYNVWTTSQHEFSHFFGAPDRYPDPYNQHYNDVMENQYSYPNYWCSAWSDWGIVNSNSAKYD